MLPAEPDDLRGLPLFAGVPEKAREKLIEKVRRYVHKLELHVFPHNEPAIALYEKFGFAREGYRRSHYRRAGELVDAILMAYFVVPRRQG